MGEKNEHLSLEEHNNRVDKIWKKEVDRLKKEKMDLEDLKEKYPGHILVYINQLSEQLQAFGVEMDRIEKKFDEKIEKLRLGMNFDAKHIETLEKQLQDHLNAPTEAELNDLARSGGI